VATPEQLSRSFSSARLLPLAWCLPLVLAIGAPAILVTRLMFLHYYPDHFVNDSPTISETASLPPSGTFFAVLMSAVVMCILVSWTLNALRNVWLIEGSDHPPAVRTGMSALSLAASLIGIIAGLFLLSLSIFGLRNGHDIHMASSWGFYIAQVLSITCDILFVLWLRRPAAAGAGALRGRATIAFSILIGSLVFLYFYESKDSFGPAIRYTVQLVYVTTENVVCLLCLAYPATAFAEMRRDLRMLAAMQEDAQADDALQAIAHR
jgi:hypothetical protein